METINGWSPPVIFDFGTGETRIATQDDLDAGTRARQELAEIRGYVNQISGVLKRVSNPA